MKKYLVKTFRQQTPVVTYEQATDLAWYRCNEIAVGQFPKELRWAMILDLEHNCSLVAMVTNTEGRFSWFKSALQHFCDCKAAGKQCGLF